MQGEPLRGALPEAGFYGLSGLEQMQALRRGLVPRPPLAHLTGLTITQVGPGTATLTLPAARWLEWGDGVDVNCLAETAMAAAVVSGLPAGIEARTGAMSLTQFRPATLDAGKLIAHARMVQSAVTFTFAEVGIEDDLGREVARATGAVLVSACDPPPPPSPGLTGRLEEPAHGTPDPHLRPLPTGAVTPRLEHWEHYEGLEFCRRFVTGDILLPAVTLFGARVVEVDRGRTLVVGRASEWLCHRSREVAPGVIASLIRVALTGACQTVALHATRTGTVNTSWRFLSPVRPDGGEFRIDARISDQQGDSLAAWATVTDSSGARIASGYQSNVLLPLRGRVTQPSETLLATVLFTDLVGSTARASDLGDERWGQLLDEHENAVRLELAAFGGREIKTTGDGFLATFDSPARAVRCARAILDASRRLGMEARAGIHCGECEFARGDVAGIAVHLASRVLAAAGPDEVLVSGTVRDLLLGSGLTFKDRGRHQLKGIEGDWPLFALGD
jgi:class 3 adenylate cyclase